MLCWSWAGLKTFGEGVLIRSAPNAGTRRDASQTRRFGDACPAFAFGQRDVPSLRGHVFPMREGDERSYILELVLGAPGARRINLVQIFRRQ
jgi:hypothetical protein